MPIFSPRRSTRSSKADCSLWRISSWQFTIPLLMLAFVWPQIAGAQMLAHPNWVGNDMSSDPWWQHAVIYRVDSGTQGLSGIDAKYLTARINAFRSLGIDALLIPAPAIPDQKNESAQPAPASSEIDSLDQLLRAASNQGVRVLLTLKPGPDQDLNGIARFWLNRGVAGFDLVTPPGSTQEQNQASLQLLRRTVASVVGQRIVLSQMDASPESSSFSSPRRPGSRAPHSTELAPALQIDTQFGKSQAITAADLRSMLQATTGRPNLIVEVSNLPSRPGDPATPHLADVLAAVALTTHPAALISSDVHLVLPPTPDHPETADAEQKPQPKAPPPPPPGVYLPFKPYVPPSKNHPATAEDSEPADPLTAWYKQLAALHHGEAAVRMAEPQFLNFDQQNAVVWVERAEKVSNLTPPVVIACNLSGSAVTLSMRSQLEALGLRGNYLRTLLRSDKAMGPQDLSTVVVPPHGVYIGELRR